LGDQRFGDGRGRGFGQEKCLALTRPGWPFAASGRFAPLGAWARDARAAWIDCFGQGWFGKPAAGGESGSKGDWTLAAWAGQDPPNRSQDVVQARFSFPGVKVARKSKNALAGLLGPFMGLLVKGLKSAWAASGSVVAVSPLSASSRSKPEIISRPAGQSALVETRLKER
jgi:hypothetical protein